MKKLFCCTLSLVFSPLLLAQDFKTPKAIPNTSEPLALPAVTQPPDYPSLVDPHSAEIIASLKGVLVHAHYKHVVERPDVFAGVRIAEPTELSGSEEFQALLANYLNKSLSYSKLDFLKREIIAHYQQYNFPITDVLIPPQDVTDGVLQLVLIEATVGEIEVTGNKHFSAHFIKNSLKTKTGDKPNIADIYRDINWLNRNPFLQVQPVFSDGEAEATTTMTLQAEDKLPLQVYAVYSDSGNDLTGKNQYSTGINYGNLWGLGHQVSYQFTTDEQVSGLKSHALNYKIPLPWQHDLSFNLSSTRTDAANDVTVTGESDEFNLTYSIPLPQKGNLQQTIAAGFDWKRSRNALEFGVIPISDTKVQQGQFNLNYQANLKSEKSSHSFGASITRSVPGLFSDQNTAAYQAVRTDAEVNYLIARLNWAYNRKFANNMLFSTSLNGQYSNTNLLNNEQLSVTGAGAVRGYDSGIFSNLDHGIIIRNELYTPEYSLLGVDQSRFLVFLDHANFRADSGNIIQPLGTSGSNTVTSAGFGLRFNIKQALSLNLDYGFQLEDVGDNNPDSQVHIQLTGQFF